MSDLAFTLDAPAPADTLPADVAALHARLDRLTELVESLDRRREEVDELVTDLMPALNGLMLQATRRMDALEQSGALAVLRAGADALRTAAEAVEPGQLRALGDGAPHGLRALRAAMEPEVAAVAEQAVAGIRAARTGRPPSLRSLWRGMREPHVRRGLGAALAVLRALGTGGGAAPSAAAPPPAPRPAPRASSSRAAGRIR